jgi:hypothetical protein
MITTRIVASLTLLAATTPRTAERTVTALPSEPTPVVAIAPQVPLLFIVDGVRYERGQEPLLSSDQIFAVRVIKGSAAIKRYGRDAAYGVVLIITRQAAGPRA